MGGQPPESSRSAARPRPASSASGQSAVAAVMLVRDAGGMVTSAMRLGTATDEFRHWDLRLYSPLCLALGTAALAARAFLPAWSPGQ